MDRLRRTNRHGVPNWILALGGLLAVFGTLIGLVAFAAPDDFAGDAIDATGLARGWGARNTALALAMGAAVALGTRTALLVSFTGALGREIGDTVNGLAESDGTAPVAITVLVLDVLVLRTLARLEPVTEPVRRTA
ncbi:MAG: hypothetical protein AAGD18_26165 [Actinomycetota bacterium]